MVCEQAGGLRHFFDIIEHGTPACSIAANHSVLPGNVPIMLCSSGVADPAAKLARRAITGAASTMKDMPRSAASLPRRGWHPA
jgi:hypothetical protein